MIPLAKRIIPNSGDAFSRFGSNITFSKILPQVNALPKLPRVLFIEPFPRHLSVYRGELKGYISSACVSTIRSCLKAKLAILQTNPDIIITELFLSANGHRRRQVPEGIEVLSYARKTFLWQE